MEVGIGLRVAGFGAVQPLLLDGLQARQETVEHQTAAVSVSRWGPAPVLSQTSVK
jgi:hypothetical protein